MTDPTITLPQRQLKQSAKLYWLSLTIEQAMALAVLARERGKLPEVFINDELTFKPFRLFTRTDSHAAFPFQEDGETPP